MTGEDMTLKTSVIICTYNYARFLPQCIESVLSQSHLPDEVIIVDDGSTDETFEVVRRFDGVRYIWQDNAGKAAAFNRGFEASSGDIICHLDADDFWLPNKLERVIDTFSKFNPMGGVIHNVANRDAHGNVLSVSYSKEMQAIDVPFRDFLATFVYASKKHSELWGVPNTICVKRIAIEPFFPIPHQIGLAVDGLLYYIAARDGLVYLPENLAVYRHHGENYFVGNPNWGDQQLLLYDYLLEHKNYGEVLSNYEKTLLAARRVEDAAIYFYHKKLIT
jgi:glycosyltransferase involved in cell wall biosynthesis